MIGVHLPSQSRGIVLDALLSALKPSISSSQCQWTGNKKVSTACYIFNYSISEFCTAMKLKEMLHSMDNCANTLRIIHQINSANIDKGILVAHKILNVYTAAHNLSITDFGKPFCCFF